MNCAMVGFLRAEARRREHHGESRSSNRANVGRGHGYLTGSNPVADSRDSVTSDVAAVHTGLLRVRGATDGPETASSASS
jgi:hypothetical protein